jgi:hypothetical protein
MKKLYGKQRSVDFISDYEYKYVIIYLTSTNLSCAFKHKNMFKYDSMLREYN